MIFELTLEYEVMVVNVTAAKFKIKPFHKSEKS